VAKTIIRKSAPEDNDPMAGIDQTVIREIMTRRRCDYIRKPQPWPIIEITDEGRKVFFIVGGDKSGKVDPKALRGFNQRHGLKLKRRVGKYDHAITRLTTIANDLVIPIALRDQAAAERDKLILEREQNAAWGGTEKRIKELKKAGKVIKTLREIQNEQILDLLREVWTRTPGRTRKESHGIVARIWNTLPDDLKINKRITPAKVKWTYDNAFQHGKINF
jgi:hypothetical protein